MQLKVEHAGGSAFVVLQHSNDFANLTTGPHLITRLQASRRFNLAVYDDTGGSFDQDTLGVKPPWQTCQRASKGEDSYYFTSLYCADCRPDVSIEVHTFVDVVSTFYRECTNVIHYGDASDA